MSKEISFAIELYQIVPYNYWLVFNSTLDNSVMVYFLGISVFLINERKVIESYHQKVQFPSKLKLSLQDYNSVFV